MFFMSSYFHVWIVFLFCGFVGLISLFVSSCFGCVRVWILGIFGLCVFLLREQFYGDFMQSFSSEKHNVKSSWTSRMNSNMLRIVLFWCNRCVELRTRQRFGETTASARDCNVHRKNGESSTVLQRV